MFQPVFLKNEKSDSTFLVLSSSHEKSYMWGSFYARFSLRLTNPESFVTFLQKFVFSPMTFTNKGRLLF